MGKTTKITLEELQTASLPLIKLLRTKGDPHTQIVVTQDGACVIRDEMGFVIKEQSKE